jgi:hypothetical protein
VVKVETGQLVLGEKNLSPEVALMEVMGEKGETLLLKPPTISQPFMTLSIKDSFLPKMEKAEEQRANMEKMERTLLFLSQLVHSS